MFTINFKDVGRDKHTWSVKLDDATEDNIERAVRDRRCLMSREIFAEVDDTGLAGTIFAGMRTVGTFTIE